MASVAVDDLGALGHHSPAARPILMPISMQDHAQELTQILEYIDSLAGDPERIHESFRSRLIPTMQRIFFVEGLQVRPGEEFNGRRFAFKLTDLDLRRPDTFVDMAFQSSGRPGLIPSDILLELDRSKDQGTTFLFIRNVRPNRAYDKIIRQHGKRLRVLDFDELKS